MDAALTDLATLTTDPDAPTTDPVTPTTDPVTLGASAAAIPQSGCIPRLGTLLLFDSSLCSSTLLSSACDALPNLFNGRDGGNGPPTSQVGRETTASTVRQHNHCNLLIREIRLGLHSQQQACCRIHHGSLSPSLFTPEAINTSLQFYKGLGYNNPRAGSEQDGKKNPNMGQARSHQFTSRNCSLRWHEVFLDQD